MHYPPTELVLNDQGKVYHLNLAPGEISDKVILVGDQKRVDLIASYFDTIEHESQYREFACKTGTYKGKRISALSTGIGTDNIDIVMNELDTLYNIDLKERKNRTDTKSAEFLRLGTCGILQPEIPVHGYILSTHALGLDNVAHFYDIPFSEEEIALNNSIEEHIQLPNKVRTYLCKSSKELFQKLSSEKTHEGITITSSGFYGPQGRQLRLPTKTRELNDRITSFNSNNQKVTNFEMESSALFALGRALGHKCATICLGIANRPNKEFSSGYNDDMMKLIQYVLDRF